MEEYSVIGKRVTRFDCDEKVMGQGKYAADFSLPVSMLWCRWYVRQFLMPES